MLRRRVLVVCSAAACVVAAGAAAGWAVPAKHASATRMTLAQLAALNPRQQGKILDPLRRVADRLGQVGRASGAAVYSGVSLDPLNGQVDLYLTDTRRAGWFFARAGLARSSAAMVRVKSARANRKTMDAARDRLWANAAKLPFRLVSIAVPVDDSSLQLGVADPSAVAAATAATRAAAAWDSGVPVTFRKDTPLRARDRTNDTPPYIAGDGIKGQGYAAGTVTGCTTGIPTIRISDVLHFIVTANHCFPGQVGVYTRGGARMLGDVVAHDPLYDAEIIHADNNADEWDNGGVYHTLAPGSGEYSYDNDLVCQDGYTSYASGAGTICNIDVYNQDYTNTITYNDGSQHTVRGVLGRQLDGETASQAGDSGALVFRVPSSGSRIVRGIVSAEAGGRPDEMFWTEAPDIFGVFDLTVNPTQ